MLKIIIGISAFLFVLIIVKIIFPKPSIFLLVFFIGMAICCAAVSVMDHKELSDVKEKGIVVEANVTKVLVAEDDDGKEYDVSFKYNFKDESYTYVRHMGNKKYEVGDSVKAYIYSNNPEELYFDESFSMGWSIFLLAIGVVAFFLSQEMTEEEWGKLYIPD